MRFLKRLLRAALESRGYVVGRASEVLLVPRPEPRAARAELFSCEGIDWNQSQADAFFPAVERHAAELLTPAGVVSYDPANRFFALVDAAVCHAFLRERAPSLVVEVGSGHSSRVIRGALERNGRGRLVSIDPEPRADISGVAHEVRRRRVQELPLAFFRELPPDGILFIDSSHRAGTGSDVNFLFLEVLPALPPGVLVHVHDIFLPEDYPPTWLDWGYGEQYLLHALLAHSTRFRVLWPGRKLLRDRRGALARVFPDADLGLHCSFWMEAI